MEYLGRILLVDDDFDMQNLLRVWLETAGYETTAASDGEEALHVLHKVPFDLTLVDYRMPKMDGLTVLKEISDRHISVGPLLLSASREVGLVVEAMRRGALDCLTKPTPAEDLLASLDEAMERQWARHLGLPPMPDWKGHGLPGV